MTVTHLGPHETTHPTNLNAQPILIRLIRHVVCLAASDTSLKRERKYFSEYATVGRSTIFLTRKGLQDLSGD